MVGRRAARQGRSAPSSFGFHLDPPPGSGSFDFRILRTKSYSRREGAECKEQLCRLVTRFDGRHNTPMSKQPDTQTMRGRLTKLFEFLKAYTELRYPPVRDINSQLR